MTQQVDRILPGKAASRERSLAPDLARGAMLLIIAVVHALMNWQMAGGAAAASGGWTDVATISAVTLLAESRGYPMFAALFGYGLMRIAMRYGQEQANTGRDLVRRRGFWLLLIGLAHTLLLSFGDILSVYGLIALVLAGLLRGSDMRVLGFGLVFAGLGAPLYAIGMTALTQAGLEAGAAEIGFWLSMGMRLAAWPVSTILFILISVFPFAIGVLAARRGIMDRPEHSVPLLRHVAGWGIAAAVLGGVPQALVATGAWAPGMEMRAASLWLHVISGYAGGLGYAALIALTAAWIGDRPGVVVGALAATGRRSLSCYLLQSVAWLALFMPFTLNLAPRLDAWQAVLVGALVWLASVIWADLSERRGWPGPAETFLRDRLRAGGRAGASGPART